MSSPQSRTVRGDSCFVRCKHNDGAAPFLRSSQPATATSNTPLKELQRRRQDGSSPISSITTSSQSGRKLQCQPGASGTLGSGPISDLGLWDHSWNRHLMPPPLASLLECRGQDRCMQHTLGTAQVMVSWGPMEGRGEEAAQQCHSRSLGAAQEKSFTHLQSTAKSSCTLRAQGKLLHAA